LFLASAQIAQAGNYSLFTSNNLGSAVTSNAVLTVSLPTPVVRMQNTNIMGGLRISLPITLVANGNENACGFSLSYSTQRLAFVSATLGNGAIGASLLLNTTMVGSGRIGIAATMSGSATFSQGMQEIVYVTLDSLPLLGATTNAANISFVDQPVPRELLDNQLQSITAAYSNSTVNILPTIFEGDVSPRTNGNQIVSTADWLQMGRFVARLDAPASSAEFQRIDCAPAASLGNGHIKVTDWVQSGRYFAGLDGLRAIGGPLAETVTVPPQSSTSRILHIPNITTTQGQSVSVPILLDVQGDENAVGFTVTFNPNVISYSIASLGVGTAGANLLVNTSQSASGKVGVAIALPPGGTLAAGTREVANIVFFASSQTTGTTPLGFDDVLVVRSVSDSAANELNVSFNIGNVTIITTNQRPSLTITKSGTNVVLSWPAWAANYALQSSTGPNWPVSWSNTLTSLQTNGGIVAQTLPFTNQSRFFRLANP
jgi:hypothetical protein